MITRLPKTVELSGKQWRIRTDYRAILDILTAFNDPDLEPSEKVYVCLDILYRDFENMPQSLYEEAYTQAIAFIDMGQKSDKHRMAHRTMDWEQDAPILFPAINGVAHTEVRSVQYLHWWTFLGYFMEIREGIFAQVLSLRQKRAKGKKLEKYEQEFWSANKNICVLQKKISTEQKQEMDRLNRMIDGKG